MFEDSHFAPLDITLPPSIVLSNVPDNGSLLHVASASSEASPSGLDALIEPVARLWCRSFGVASPHAISRLKTLLKTKVQDVLKQGLSFDQVQNKLDEAAEAIIRVWFTLVLDRPIAPTGKALAIVRLAFLDSNYEERWSDDFLSDTVPVQELAAELNASMPEPTPTAEPRQMLRQII